MPTSPPFPQAWEDLVKVQYHMGRLCLLLESTEGYVVEVPCEDLAELHRLARVTEELAEGYQLTTEWVLPGVD